MSRAGDRSSTPRAVIHKRILDVAAANPTASMEEIADEIGGASTDLVERVLEEYGDPVGNTGGGDAGDEATDHGSGGTTETAPKDTMTEFDTKADENGRTGEEPLELTGKQLDTLRLIAEDPSASQADLAEELGVTRATISRWLNDIPDFEWVNRREIAAEILDEEEPSGPTSRIDPETVADLRQRLEDIERWIDRVEAGEGSRSVDVDPELAHKVVHACMRSEQISEQEELRLLKELMG